MRVEPLDTRRPSNKRNIRKAAAQKKRPTQPKVPIQNLGTA